MPVKTTRLASFYVHSPEFPLDGEYKEYLARFQTNRNQIHGNLVDWLSNSPSYSAASLKGRLIQCPKFFSTFRPVKPPFAVLNWEFKILHGDSQIPQIEQALDFVSPFSWFGRGSIIYLFGNNLWQLTKYEETLSADELRLVFLEAVDAERRKFEKLQSKFSGVAARRKPSQRERIQESVKIYVWRRDEGKCVQCGSSERLEFDHIIPVEKGGGSTERNIQLLCEGCNRKKGCQI